MSDNSDLLEDTAKCKDCRGIGRRLEKGLIVVCHCVNDALYKYRLSISNIPPRFKEWDFSKYVYKNSDTFKKVEKYLNQSALVIAKGVGLYFYGFESDCNLLAIGSLKELMKSGHTCYYTPYSACIAAANSQQELHLMDDAYTFLCITNIDSVLDNLTNFKQAILSGAPTNFAVSYLEQIISTRATKAQPTFLTSSVSPEILVSKFPSLSTIAYGNLLPVECVAEDFRKKALSKLKHEIGFDQIGSL